MPNKQNVQEAAATATIVSPHNLEEAILQALSFSLNGDLEAASIDSEDGNRLNIRLGERLGFIKRIVLSDDRIVHNMNYSGTITTATEIIKAFEPFGASPPPNLPPKEIGSLLESLFSE